MIFLFSAGAKILILVINLLTFFSDAGDGKTVVIQKKSSKTPSNAHDCYPILEGFKRTKKSNYLNQELSPNYEHLSHCMNDVCCCLGKIVYGCCALAGCSLIKSQINELQELKPEWDSLDSLFLNTSEMARTSCSSLTTSSTSLKICSRDAHPPRPYFLRLW